MFREPFDAEFEGDPAFALTPEQLERVVQQHLYAIEHGLPYDEEHGSIHVLTGLTALEWVLALWEGCQRMSARFLQRKMSAWP